MADAPDRAAPLAAVRVLNLGTRWPGRVAAMLLADQGADVVEIVRPGRETHAADPLLDRGKRLVELDLKVEAARRACRDRAAEADVVFENMRPGATAALGLDYSGLDGERRGLIHVSLPGFAEGDPMRDIPAWEGTIDASVGVYTNITPPQYPARHADLLGHPHGFGLRRRSRQPRRFARALPAAAHRPRPAHRGAPRRLRDGRHGPAHLQNRGTALALQLPDHRQRSAGSRVSRAPRSTRSHERRPCRPDRGIRTGPRQPDDQLLRVRGRTDTLRLRARPRLPEPRLPPGSSASTTGSLPRGW